MDFFLFLETMRKTFLQVIKGDILIENSAFKFSIELYATGNGEELMRKIWRYGEAIERIGFKIKSLKNINSAKMYYIYYHE